jgi:hypothetical protein
LVSVMGNHSEKKHGTRGGEKLARSRRERRVRGVP